jgi:hypothetical protein
VIFSEEDSQPKFYGTNRYFAWTLAAPSGAGINIGTPSLGVHVLGADCAINEYGVG